MVQRFVFLFTFLTQLGAFGLQCRYVYRQQPPTFERQVHIYAMTEPLQRQLEQMQKLWLSSSKAQFISERLKRVAVEHEIRDIRSEGFPFLKETVVVIRPVENGSFLNHLAFKMQQNFNVEMLYSTKLEKGTLAAYSPDKKRIYITSYSALTGLVDHFLMHEIRHAAMDAREDKDNHDLINGQIRKRWFVQYPWLQTNDMAYPSYMSLQEFRTFYQDRNFTQTEFWKRLKALKKPELFSMNIDRDLLANAAYEDVFQQTAAVLDYFSQHLTNDKIVQIKENVESENLEIESNGFNYYGHFFVPKSFVQAAKQRLNYSSPLSVEAKKEIAQLYLQEFKNLHQEASQREEKYQLLKIILNVAKNLQDETDIFARAQQTRSMRDLLKQVDTFAAELTQLRADKQARFDQLAAEQGLTLQKTDVQKIRNFLKTKRDSYKQIIAVKYTYEDNGKVTSFYGGTFDLNRFLTVFESEGRNVQIEMLSSEAHDISPAESELRDLARQLILFR